VLEKWGIMTEDADDGSNTDERSIAGARRRAFELGEGCLILAKIEAERLAQSLGRTPSFGEKVLLEHVAYVNIRIGKLREWGLHGEAEKATRLLATLLKNFEKERKLTLGKLLEEEIQ
jgi:hypothetical protein